MRFHFTDEQTQFRDTLRRFLQTVSPTTAVRRAMVTESGYDAAVWKRMAHELGLNGLVIPEQYGGAGFGLVELCIAMEEMGRSLLCAPFLGSSVLATYMIRLAATDDQKQRMLPALAAGESIAALAFAERNGGFDASSISTLAARVGDRYVLTGEKFYVLDGMSADALLVVARIGVSDGLSLFLVRPDAKGLTRRALEVIDPTRKLAGITFDRVDAELIGDADTAAPALERTLDLGNIALANEMVGGAARLLEDTLAYTKMRVQFGRAIASFQAVKHRCAEMLLSVELAKSAAYFAAEAVDEGRADVDYLSSLAKACASETYLQTAIDAIQLHGGIGFTFDQDTHLWFKRAKSSEVLFGDATWHRRRMMQRLPAKEVA